MKTLNCCAVIFDLDGTLIDSEGNYGISDGLLFAEYGIDFNEEHRKDLIGRGADEFLIFLREKYHVTDDRNIVLAKKNAYYLDIARKNTRVFPEMLELLKGLRERGVPLAVASGSPRLIIQEMLAICKIEEYFSAIVSSEETPRGKPFPDVFLEAARRLGMKPEDCLVFEDSPFGVEAAAAAKMPVVAIPTITEPPLHLNFLKADVLYPAGIDSFRAEDVLRSLRFCVPAIRCS